MSLKTSNNIKSSEDLKKELLATKVRIQLKENELRDRVKQVPGELFYSGVDSIIPSVLSGRVSSFALNAGKGLINNFFVRKAVTAGSYHVLSALKPSNLVRKLASGAGSLFKKKKNNFNNLIPSARRGFFCFEEFFRNSSSYFVPEKNLTSKNFQKK